MTGTAPPPWRASLLALLVFAATSWAAVLLFWNSPADAYAGIDFNAAVFEDFLGSYWPTAQSLAEGNAIPAPGYVYPSTLAWALAPWTLVARDPAGGSMAASWMAVLFVALGTWLLIAGAFALRRPAKMSSAALFGAALGLSHAVIHGAYWGQVSALVLGLSALAFACLARAGAPGNRPGLELRAGALIGLAAALKLYPALFLVVPMALGHRRTLTAAFVTVVITAVLIPLALMGPQGFGAFHVEAGERLLSLARQISTPDGGAGSLDAAALFQRALGEGAGPTTWLLGKGIGLGLGASCVALAVRAARAQRDLCRAFVFSSAAIWLVVTPCWPHALAWVPIAWWGAYGASGTPGRLLVAASFATGSILALVAVGDPFRFTELGIPALSACLGVGAILAPVRQSAAENPGRAPHP